MGQSFFQAQLEEAKIKTAESDENAEVPMAREIGTLGVCSRCVVLMQC
jgi:hypothetical protein